MSKIYYILLKTHNQTGLKYLCRHVSEYEATCYSYPGSGTRWRAHLNKHGNDCSTEILAECRSEQESKDVGIQYSNLWNIVDDDNFANLIPEEGQGGAYAASFRKTHSGWRGFKMVGDDNPSKRPEVREKISKALSGRKCTWGDKISKSMKGTVPWNKDKKNPHAVTTHMNITVSCPHCPKEGGHGAMVRWHFDNCKFRE